MAFCSVMSAALQGLFVEPVSVEADISNGLPMFHMVGYLSSEVKEASERVRTAIKNAGVQIPAKKTVINLAPADVKKKGASFDLPIALAILGAMGNIRAEQLEDTIVIGELSLGGEVKRVSGVLPIVLEGKQRGIKKYILPKENVSEGILVDGVQILGVERLEEVCVFFNKEEKVFLCSTNKQQFESAGSNASQIDFSDVRGQEAVKRAVEVAVAGGHNILFIGPPGSGKSMIAQRIPTILPQLSMEESMEITKIYSVMGLLDKEKPLITERPFRSVHHTITKSALVGGGKTPIPGEISLAHGGVLFLDELAEFQKPVLEVLRQPLEERKIRISRSHGNYVFPSNFILAAAMNPCPCGNYPDLSKCNCTEGQIKQYLGRISQPFLDRIDICIETPRIQYEELKANKKQEDSETIRKRVELARKIQRDREKNTGVLTNSLLSVKQMEQICRLGKKEEKLMKMAFENLSLTARTYHKILRVARTIADLEGQEIILEEHLKEALAYRTIDKKYWGR